MRWRIVVAALSAAGILLILIGIWNGFNDERPTLAPIVNGPDYNGPSRSATQATGPLESTPARTGLVMPVDEEGFVRAVQEGQVAFQRAPNEMAQGGTRSRRRLAICQILRRRSVSGWIGRIAKLSSNSDGKGVLEISLADSIRVETWNNDLSDVSDETLIDPSTALFALLSQMKQGDQVVFSGTFIPSDTDCVKESSMSLGGSMTDPEFVFRFSSVGRAF
jgi:hypothetical protein